MIRSVFVLAIGVLMLYSCGKDAGDPTMYFVEGEGFLSKDTMLMVGDSARVGLFMEWNGKDDLDNLEVTVNGNFVGNYYVEQNRGEYAFNLSKDHSDSEKWVFTLTDRKNHLVTQQITFTKDPNSVYGGVVAVNNVVLGTQANPVKAGFLSLEGPTIYDLESALSHKDEIDILLFYGDETGMTIASPASEIPADIFDEDKNPLGWDTRNQTLFMLSDYLPDDFSKFFHDGFFISVFDQELATDLAPNLEAEQVYLFRTETGRLGSLLINSVSESVDGEVDFSIVMQVE